MEPQNTTGDNADLIQVAKFQKYLLILVLINLISILLVRIIYINIIIGIGQLYFTYEIGKGLKLKYIWLWMVGMLIPFLNLILILIINSKATRFIRAHGFRVGILGADLKAIRAQTGNGGTPSQQVAAQTTSQDTTPPTPPTDNM